MKDSANKEMVYIFFSNLEQWVFYRLQSVGEKTPRAFSVKVMDKEGVKISTCIIRTVAEKLKAFIEEHEASFKFQPWQMTSTRSILRKTFHRGLHERAVHYLWDTGTAREILNFSTKNKKSVKVQDVVDYLYSFLGINIHQVNLKSRVESSSQRSNKISKKHILWHNAPACNISNDLVDERVFEIKKLVESVAQELAYLFALNEENSISTQHSWKVSRYHMTSVKKQKLACCSYPSCLFNIRKQQWYKEQKDSRKKIHKLLKTKNVGRKVLKHRQVVPVGRSYIQKRTPKITKNITNVQKPQMKPPAPRPTVEIATQTTSWRQDSQLYSSSYQDTLRRVCEQEESSEYEEEDEYYCKSDTLNDASMITEEIASEFDVDFHRQQSRSRFECDSKIMNVPQNGKQRRKSNVSNEVPRLKNAKIEKSKSNEDSVVKCASGKRKSYGNSKGMVKNQLSIEPLTSKSPNVSSRTKTGSTDIQRVTEAQTKEDTSSKRSYSKSSSSFQEKQKGKDSKDRQRKSSSSSEKSKVKPKLDLQEGNHLKNELDSTKDTPKSPVKLLLESPDFDHEIDIEQLDNISKIFNKFEDPGRRESEANSSNLPAAAVVTSSDNETTYLPVVSSSENGGSVLAAEERRDDSNGSSSIKEDDNTSPEYSSHWTEDSSSTEVSESEVDESFRRKFICYKRRLLEDSDGVVASSEDETLSSKGNSSIQDGVILCNGKSTISREIPPDSIFSENLKKLQQHWKRETNLIQYVNEKGMNLLHLAATEGFEDFIKELLNYGIPIESITNDGYTPLKLAVMHNNLTCCKMLLLNGASLIRDDGTFDKDVLELATTSPMKRLLMKYEENLGRLKMISDVLNQFGEKKKNVSTFLSKDLLKSLADLTLEEDEMLTSSGVS